NTLPFDLRRRCSTGGPILTGFLPVEGLSSDGVEVCLRARLIADVTRWARSRSSRSSSLRTTLSFFTAMSFGGLAEAARTGAAKTNKSVAQSIRFMTGPFGRGAANHFAWLN